MQCEDLSHTQTPHNPKVVGSNPAPATIKNGLNTEV